MNRTITLAIFMVILFGTVKISNVLIEVKAEDHSINVLYPTSEATWYRLESIPISVRWVQSDYSWNDIKIELYKDGDYYLTIVEDVRDDPGFYHYWDGLYSYCNCNIPPIIEESNSYQFKLTRISTGIYDFSEEFSIVEQTITILSPSSGDVWYRSGTYTIYWQREYTDYVLLEFYKDGTYYSTIDTHITALNYEVDIPMDMPLGDTYQIRIQGTGIAGQKPEAISDFFSIDERTISINSSNISDIIYWGDSQIIYWDSHAAGASVKIELFENDSYHSTISDRTSNSGVFTWRVPKGIEESTFYKLKITSIDYDNVNNTSDFFSILERYISITSPQLNEIWYKNQTYNITWDSKNVFRTIGISLINQTAVNEFQNYHYIVQNISNNGSYKWLIPEDFPSGEYTLLVYMYNNESSYDQVSDSVNITIETWIEPLEPTPGFEVLFVIIAIALIIFWIRKRNE